MSTESNNNPNKGFIGNAIDQGVIVMPTHISQARRGPDGQVADVWKATDQIPEVRVGAAIGKIVDKLSLLAKPIPDEDRARIVKRP